jgi:hypothetical protein
MVCVSSWCALLQGKNMVINFHPHALERLAERGATEDEVRTTVEQGEQFPAKFGRTGFRRNFLFNDHWRGRYFQTKQVEAFAVSQGVDWLVITVITRYF